MSYVCDEELYRLPVPAGLYIEGDVVCDISGLICCIVDIPYFSRSL